MILLRLLSETSEVSNSVHLTDPNSGSGVLQCQEPRVFKPLLIDPTQVE